MTNKEELELEEELSKFETLGEAVEFLKFRELLIKGSPIYEGKVVTFEGRIGSGMTLSAVAFAYQMSLLGKKTISNATLNFPFTSFSLDKVLGYTNKVILLDNSWLYLDSRRTNSNSSRLLIYSLSQNRKLGNTVLLTSPSLNYLDPRVRRLVDIRCFCLNIGRDQFIVRLKDLRAGKAYKLILHGPAYYSKYNTLEIIRL